MKIKEIFVKDLFRNINGVVKAEQLDPAVVWQELDEFVVTKELLKHFNQFFTTYLEYIDNPRDPMAGSSIGVWISGFFGSGKSHFLKILTYLLSGVQARNPETGETKRPVDFLKNKIPDAMLFSTIERAVNYPCDTVLFNIDSKADVHEDSQSQMLSVFTKVFNELQGFCGQYPWVAELESHLQEDNLLELFKGHFNKLSKKDWTKERDRPHFNQDEIIEALRRTKNMSPESSARWFENAEKNYQNSADLFAKRVKKYLDSKNTGHRIVFFVDEMGQFIGSEGRLMLNLQTIVEDLGIHCGGRAWVVVTSQEDIEATIGDMKTSLKKDLTKIMGRFKCRLSLSSSNADEVIQSRLLEKTPSAKIHLSQLFDEKKDIIRNQVSFTSDCATLKNFENTDNFVINYPFIPYQYQLLQKVLETIRTSGVAGAHLSRGERSMLDSFQIAAQMISDSDIGTLIPLHSFYAAIEGFLDTSIKLSINHAADNESLKPFDIDVLKTLFLIRRIDNLVKPNIDNLVTLSIPEVDADRLGLRESIGESLNRLEKETLIHRSGSHYYFLTNEERDVGTQIKNTDVSITELTRLLSELIYEEVIKADNKYTYPKNKKGYGYNKLLDGTPHGTKMDNELTVDLVTPLSDYYDSQEHYFITRSTDDHGKIVIKLKDHPELIKELETYKKTDKFISSNYSSGSDSFKRILEDRSSENKQRRTRIISILSDILVNSDYFVCGKSLQVKSSTPQSCIFECLEYLITNVYSKLHYIKKSYQDPIKELKHILTSDVPTQQALIANIYEENGDAVHEIQNHIRLASGNNKLIELSDIVKKFSSRPFGWSDWDIVIIVARLLTAKEIRLVQSGEALETKQAFQPLSKTQQWKQISIQRMKVPNKEDLEKSRHIGKEVFGIIGPDDADALSTFLKDHLNSWKTNLSKFKIIANTGEYPGKIEIDKGLSITDRLLSIGDNYEFFSSFNESEEEITQLELDMRSLEDFYDNHVSLWNNLAKKVAVYKQIQTELEARFPEEKPVQILIEILQDPKPYSRLKHVNSLIEQVDSEYSKILETTRKDALEKVQNLIDTVRKKSEEVKANADLSNQALKPLQDIKKRLEVETTIPQVSYHLNDADTRFEEALEILDKSVRDPDKPVKKTETVKVSSLSNTGFFETEQEVENFINKLRNLLLEKIRQNSRVKIS
jgi:hypothetical protein